MNVRSRAAVAAIVAVAVAFTGCSSKSNSGSSGGSSGSASTTSASANADAASLVQHSADAMKQLTGVHMSLVVQGNIPNLSVSKVDADLSDTPKAVGNGTATVKIGNASVDAKFVFVDGHLYSDAAKPGSFTDYGDGASIYPVSVMLDPNKGIANLLAKLSNPTNAGSDTINGVQTTKITGTSSSNDVATISGSRIAPAKATTVPTTVWIATDGSYHAVQVEIDPPGGSVTATFSDWNKQVTATKPTTTS
jgi:lipoprotein LprA